MSAGGEGGIRTPDRGVSPYNGLANRRLQPLGHLSVQIKNGKELSQLTLSSELPRKLRSGFRLSAPAQLTLRSRRQKRAQLQPLGHLSVGIAARDNCISAAGVALCLFRRNTD